MQIAATMKTNQTIRINSAKQVDVAGHDMVPADPSYGDPNVSIADQSFGSYSVFSSLFTPSGKTGNVTINYSSPSTDAAKPTLHGSLVLTIEGQVADSLLPTPGVPTP